jgi:TP901 family phage tail tape measure protein
MASREIEARLKISAVDRASRVIAGVGRTLDELDRKARAMNRAEAYLAQSAAATREANRQILLGTAAAAGAAVVAGAAAGKAAVVDYAALERQITRIGITAGATDEQIRGVSTAIMRVAQDTATPLQDVYDGFDGLIAAGRGWDESLAFLPAVVKTAQAAGAATRDIAQSADALAGSMGITGAQMEEAFDKLVQGGKLGKFELRDMASYLPSLLPQMRQLGYSGLDGLEQTIAMLQTVRLQTGTAGEAATNLTNVLGKIYSPETIKKFKKEFGIDIVRQLEKATASGEDLLEAFIRITREATGGDMEKLSSLFADQQLRAGILALMQGGEAWARFKDGVENAAGAVEGDLRRVLGNTQADLDKLSNSWDGFVASVGKFAVSLGVGSALDRATENLTAAAQFLNEASDKGVVEAAGNAWERDRLNRAAQDPGAEAYIKAYTDTVGRPPTPEEAERYAMFGDPDRWGSTTFEERARIGLEEGRRAGVDADREERFAIYKDREDKLKAEREAYFRKVGLHSVQTTGIYAKGTYRQLMPPMPVATPGAGSLYPLQDNKFHPYSKPLDAPHVGTVLDLMPGATKTAEELQQTFEGLDLATPVGQAMNEALAALAEHGAQLRAEAKAIMSGVKAEFSVPIPPIRPQIDASGVRVNRGESMPDN